MKTKQQNGSNGFFVPLIVTIVVIFIFGVGIYAYLQSDKNSQVLPGNSPSTINSTSSINSNSADNSTSTTTESSTDSNIVSTCGFKITSHLKNQTVSFPILVKGVVDNTDAKNSKCSWGMFEGQAGSARLYYDVNPVTFNSEKWLPIGQGVPINVDNWMTLLTNFSAIFNDDKLIIKNGTRIKIVFQEEDPSGMQKLDSVELPLVIGNNLN